MAENKIYDEALNIAEWYAIESDANLQNYIY